MSYTPLKVSTRTTEDALREDELSCYNFILEQLHGAWPTVEDIDDVCKLALTQAKVLQLRREAAFPMSSGHRGGSAYLTPAAQLFLPQ